MAPFPAGGTTEVLGRLMGQQLGPVLGQVTKTAGVKVE